MDHIRVREGYKIWHAASHMDDALQAPTNTPWFDGWNMGTESDSPYDAYEHIPGLNVGGWYDAGDFDIQTSRNIQVIQDLALAYKEYGVDYDTMTVEWDDNTANGATGGSVELHRPDGIPDIQQQIKHGILQILAQQENVGFVFRSWKSPPCGSIRTWATAPRIPTTRSSRLKAPMTEALAGTKNPSLQLNAAAANGGCRRCAEGL